MAFVPVKDLRKLEGEEFEAAHAKNMEIMSADGGAKS